ncbi:ABC transporter substrate-binding protein [Candidatus Daviesbacteria bacterium]|nr:ABC transporter substrate-binding protein [Candidatus Daviesbacteria bacterium]
MRRIWFSLVLISLVVLLGVFFLATQTGKQKPSLTNSKTQPTTEKIKLGKSINPVFALPIDIAQKKKIFEKHDLEVEVQAVPGAIADSLISGKVEYFVEGISTFLSSATKGSGIKWFATVEQVEPYYLISKKPKDQIKKVGVLRIAGEDNYHAMVTLDAFGIDPKTIQFVPLGSYEAKYPSLLNGSVDAVGFPPLPVFLKLEEQFKKDGVSVLIKLAETKDAYYPSALVALDKTLNSKKDASNRLAKALEESVQYARSNREEVLGYLINDYKLSRQEAEEIYDKNFMPATTNLDPKPRVELVKKILEFISLQDETAKSFKAGDFIFEI